MNLVILYYVESGLITVFSRTYYKNVRLFVCLFSRYYGNGVLKEKEMIIYVQHHALLWEYYRKAKEIVLGDITAMLDELYKGESFKKLAAG